jgi:hypothetical protein
MATQIEHMAPRLAAKLHRVLEAHFGGDPMAACLCAEFLSHEEYDRGFVTKILAVSEGSGGDSWNIRLFATLMLANQCRHLDPGNEEEFKFLFRKFGILSPDEKRMDNSVLAEGYTSTDFKVFIAQFLGNLNRLERIYRTIRGRLTTPRALDRFVRLSREPWKLSLARYLFTPGEVVDHLLDQLNLSSGVRGPMTPEGERQAELCLSRLAGYEKEIFRLLANSACVYWARESTPREMNSMLENPIGTVVCVVKAPGSPLEFEIKRTGLRANYPLTASFTDHIGELLPPSHRLQGGASTASLRWESTQAAVLSDIYRSVHGTDAPVSKLLTLATFRTVPFKGEDVHLIDYFTDPNVFGDSYQNMREQMERCVSDFDLLYGDDLAQVPGEVGLTGRFIAHALPSQGILTQTSSCRIDRLATYLSPTGADEYFIRGLKRTSYTKQEAQQFADALLDEVLGIYSAPTAYENHAQYLRAAFAIRENRNRADRFHALTTAELGRYWGTILALGAYSFGESFVGRNLGLKSSFEAGEWTVRLLFMDHDNLRIPDKGEVSFWPYSAFRASVVDEAYICANPDRPLQIDGSSLWHLEQIYHVNAETRLKSKEYLHQAMENAYRQTRRGMDTNRSVQRFFSKSYIRHMHDWDVVVADYLTNCGDPMHINAWKLRPEAYLSRMHYKKAIIDDYLLAIEKHYDVFTRYSFLYLP